MKKLLFFLVLFLATGGSLFAQGAFYRIGPFQQSGLAYVCPVPDGGTPCPSPVAIFTNSALTTPLNNPISMPQGASVSFWVTPGQYTIQFPNSGFNQIVQIGGGGGTGLPGGGSVGNTVVNTAPGVGTWQGISALSGICTAPQGCTGVGSPTAHALLAFEGSSPAQNVCTPPSANGDYNIVYHVTGAAAVDPTCPQVGLGGAAGLTGAATTYTVLYSDNGTILTHAQGSSGAINVTLPTATTLGNASFAFRWSNHSAQTDTITPTTWTIQSNASAGGATTTIASGVTCLIKVDPNSATQWVADCSGSSALSSIGAATASSTIANGNNPIVWNWAQTTDAQDAFTFGETSAATGGTLTNNLANQAELHVTTASGSTASPLEVEQVGITATTGPPAVQIESTWNNASLVGYGLLFNVTNSNSAAASRLWEFRVGNTAQGYLDKSGNMNALTSLSTSTGCPNLTAGTGATDCLVEGTAPSANQASADTPWADSIAHSPKVMNNGSLLQSLYVLSEPSPISLAGQVATITNGTSLCAAAAGACNQAGQYRATIYLDSTVVCATPGPAAAAPTLTWTDETGVKSAVPFPMFVNGSTTPASSITLGNTTSWGSGSLTFWSTGAVIGYGVAWTACTSGTATYAVRIAVERLQ